jgi:hypothetical protein
LDDGLGKVEIEFSCTPRALSAPGEVAVWPTSITTRNVERGQVALSLVCCVAVSSARTGCQIGAPMIAARAAILNANLLMTMIKLCRPVLRQTTSTLLPSPQLLLAKKGSQPAA